MMANIIYMHFKSLRSVPIKICRYFTLEYLYTGFTEELRTLFFLLYRFPVLRV
jgi:hypothetical protein